MSTKISIGQWNTKLIITLKNGHQLRMVVDPNRVDEVKQYIDSCIIKSGNCWFTDVNVITHCGIRGGKISSAETKVEKAPSVRDLNDWVLIISIYLNDNSVRYFETTLSSYKNISILLTDALYEGRPYLPEETMVDGSEMLAFNLSAERVCACPLQKLNLQGCPSTRGLRCPSRGSLPQW